MLQVYVPAEAVCETLQMMLLPVSLCKYTKKLVSVLLPSSLTHSPVMILVSLLYVMFPLMSSDAVLVPLKSNSCVKSHTPLVQTNFELLVVLMMSPMVFK